MPWESVIAYVILVGGLVFGVVFLLWSAWKGGRNK